MLDFIGKWRDKVTDYVDTRVQIVKLEFVERTSHILSFMAIVIICMFLLTPVLLFTGMGLAEMFADMVDSRSGGYFIVAGIYLVVLLLLFVCRKYFTDMFSGIFISVMTRNNDKEEQEDKKD